MKLFYPLLAIILLPLLVSAQRFEWLSGSQQTSGFASPPKIKTDAQGNVFSLSSYSGDLIVGLDTLPDQGGTSYSLIKFGSAGNHIWSKWFKLGNGNYSDMCIDANGYVYISLTQNNSTTYIDADTTFSSGPGNWIISFDNSGSVRWINGGASNNIMPLASSLQHSGFYAGIGNSIFHYGSDGALIWSTTTTSGSVFFNGLSCNNANRIAVSGRTTSNGTITLDTVSVNSTISSNDQILFQMDTSGSVIWGYNIPFTGTNVYGLMPVGIDQTANVFVLFNNGSLSSFIFAGDTLTNPGGAGVAFCGILKFSASGTPQWAKGHSYGSNNILYLDMIVNNSNEIIACGSYQGTAMFETIPLAPATGNPTSFIVKVNTNGSPAWAKQDYRMALTHYDESYSLSNGINNTYNVGGLIANANGLFYTGCNFAIDYTHPGNYFTNISEAIDTVPSASFNYSSTVFTYLFNNTSQGATSWHWDFGNGDTSNLQSPTYTYPTGGAYTVTLSVYFGNCGSSTTQQLLNVSVEEPHSLLYFNLIPNPAHENTYCDFRLTKDAAIQIELIDISGRATRVLNTVVLPAGNHSEKLNLKQLAPGLYFARMFDGERSYLKKIIIN